MLIDGNNMIELLSLPEWDERIVAMLEEFGEERPVYDPKDTIKFIRPEGYAIEMMFDTKARTEQQKEHLEEGNLWFNQIGLNNNTTIKLPYNINAEDNYISMSKKIGKKADYKNKDGNKTLHWLLDDGEKKYFLNCNFSDDNLTRWNNIWFNLFNSNLSYRGLIPNE